MIVDLRELPILYINLDKHKERRIHLENLSSRLGLNNVQRIPAVLNQVGFLGLLESQIIALESQSAPFLLLEDDVVEKTFQGKFFIPDDADAVYLGTSGWAVQGSKISHNLKFSQSSIPGIFRIFNMLSTHAILFVNEEFRIKCLQALKENFKATQLPCDVIFAEMQKRHKVYCFDIPMFTQGEFGDAMSDAPLWTQDALSEYPRSFLLFGKSIPVNRIALKRLFSKWLSKFV